MPKGKSGGQSSRSSRSSSNIKATVDKDSSVNVRQIKNGFIVSENGTRGKGRNKEYYSDEYFSKTNPVRIAGSNGNGGGMKFGKK